MASTVKELRDWIKDMPDDTLVGISEGGLILLSSGNGYFELGGWPEDAEHPMASY